MFHPQAAAPRNDTLKRNRTSVVRTARAKNHLFGFQPTPGWCNGQHPGLWTLGKLRDKPFGPLQLAQSRSLPKWLRLLTHLSWPLSFSPNSEPQGNATPLNADK